MIATALGTIAAMIARLLERLPRMPLPDLFGVVWGYRRPTQTPERLDLIGTLAFGAEVVCLLALPVIAVVAGANPAALWACVMLWLLAGLADWLAASQDSKLIRMAGYVGFQANLRAAIRSVFVLAAFAIAGAGQAALGYLLVVGLAQVIWAVLATFAHWLAGLQAPLRYDPIAAKQDAAFAKYRRAYAPAVGVPAALVAAEAVALVGVLLPTWAAWFALAAAVTILCYLVLGVDRFRKSRASVDVDTEKVAADLALDQPSYLYYVDASLGQSKYIANQWLPVFDQAPQSGVVMVRVASELPIISPTHLSIVLASTPRSVERLTLPTIRAAFYGGFALKNTQLMRNPSIKHVMLNHGDSDKASSFNATAAAYDELWVAGQAAVDRYEGAGIHVPADHYALIGRPQVESLKVGPLSKDPKVVLYAPTWEGYFDQTDYTSLDRCGAELVAWLLREHPEIHIWFKPHPSSGRFRSSMLAAKARIGELLRAAGPAHVLVDDLGYSLAEAMNHADVLVTDVSSVASDFLATRRPLLVTNPADLTEAEFEAAYPGLAWGYQLRGDLANVAQAFNAAFGVDPLAPQREAAAGYILGDHPDGPQQTFNRAMARITS